MAVERSSMLRADAERVWTAAISPEGINDELRPVCRMTVPAGGLDLDSAVLSLPARLGRSWILLFGMIPVEYDDLVIVELTTGHFLEQSTMATMSLWRHERWVTDVGSGSCQVSDRVEFELRPWLRRAPGMERVAATIVGRLFRHRHQRLRRRWGSAD